MVDRGAPRIVEETMTPGASVARVAREHGVNANQVFSWRRQYRRGLLGSSAGIAGLLPVKIADQLPAGRSASVETDAIPSRPAAAGTVQVLVGKVQLRIEGEVDREVLRLVLEHVLP